MDELAFHWDDDIEIILKLLVKQLSELCDGTEYHVKRNPTEGEKCVNLYRTDSVYRVAHIWPRKKNRVFNFAVTSDIFTNLKSKMTLPPDKDVKPDRYLKWREFHAIEAAMMLDIFKNVVGYGEERVKNINIPLKPLDRYEDNGKEIVICGNCQNKFYKASRCPECGQLLNH